MSPPLLPKLPSSKKIYWLSCVFFPPVAFRVSKVSPQNFSTNFALQCSQFLEISKLTRMFVDFFFAFFLFFFPLLSKHQKYKIDTITKRFECAFVAFRPRFSLQKISFLLKTLNSQEGKKPEKKTNEAEDREEKERKRIRTIAARGLFQKIFKSDEITLNNSPNKEKIENMFPSASLPPPLPHPASPFPLSFSEIFNATRAIKRGAAPGLSGWTRELFLPLVSPPPPQQFCSFLVPFFSSILSGSFPYPEIFDFITDGILVIFSYLSQPEKQRPIIIKEFFLKICWKILLQNMPDDPLLLSLCSSFGRKDGCPSVVHAVQTALNNGVEVLSSDFENCFNLIDRNFVFEYLRKNESIYSSLFPLLNICYARKTNCFNFKNFLPNFHINILTGTCQGCVSGPFFLELAKAPTLSILQQEISLSSVSVADDI